ncbi:MAG: hypothetical protein COX79_04250 [Candidatus Levybacteria bacterium CG_4_10_14_0_2_um_filter_36_16]|nr:MAG: hypothetical protein AUK12_02310 [Candidatus Levybacteria bacterium CG2_30_37_29]PIR79145.1 MAG: hypothetical protein COU26_02805 [Candidatus Levybacteria bacterium CG10_big_fil_rev_8_21_14_0_10_36_30]PIZ96779.1 MAG: hypothetical protein COX79_04250 [Candidatus Levybacteria bacterium CG_4_10_14_0_2_um_filter_36_16]PJA90665.1 MAG: hypothetical protein CO136_01125 [Candidatus Levybacteria bacterium CG_4_9_14_3_um_filter_36_7]
MKVLFIAPYFYPSIGGVEKHVLEISKRLVKKGFSITIIAEDKNSDVTTNYQDRVSSDSKANITKKTVKSIYFDNKIGKKIRVFRFKFGRANRLKKFKIWYCLFKNRKLIQEADIIHCHDVFIWYLPFRFLYPNKKVYTTFHGYESYPIKKGAWLVHKISEKLSNGNICVGEYLHKWYGTNPTYLTYGAVTLPKAFPKIKKNISALFWGRLDVQTSILEYCKAVKILKKKYPEFFFRVIGDGKQRKEVENYVSVEGFKLSAEHELSKYRFAFVSRYLSTLEAMAAKRLVFVLYDNPVKKDCFAMGPFAKRVILVGSAEELVSKVEYYLSNPKEEKKIINEAFEWVSKQSWDRLIAKYLSLWKQT